MADMTKPNMELLQTLEAEASKLTQKQVCDQFWGGAQSSNHHQVAFIFEFSDDFPPLNLASGQSDNSVGERMIRLIETLNTPNGIKADIFTRTKNNGTIQGILPGVSILGTPMAPEDFVIAGKWVLTCYVRANNLF